MSYYALPEEWGVKWTDQEIDEDLLGNKIVWIVAKVIAHTFGKASGVTERSLRRDRMRLIEELETWRGSLPTPFAGLPFGTPSEEGFVKRLFAISSTGGFIFLVLLIQLIDGTAAAMCMYHLAYLLLLTEGRNPSLTGEIPRVCITNYLVQVLLFDTDG